MKQSLRYSAVAVKVARLFCVTALFGISNAAHSIERISITPNGFPNDGESNYSSVSADGNLIAFYSNNSKLVPNDTNGQSDVFVYNRAAKTFERVSVATGGGQASALGYFIKITPNGRYVLFESTSPDLVTGDNNSAYDLFVHDRQTGMTTRESVGIGGAEGNHFLARGDISADGRFVVFSSDADSFGFTDNNSTSDVFLRDRQLGTTTLISDSYSVASPKAAIGLSTGASISDDGRFILFLSSAPDLVFGDNNGGQDVFLLDRQESQLSIVTAGGNCGISSDGEFAFVGKIPSPPLPGEPDGIWGVIAYPINGGPARRVTANAQGQPVPMNVSFEGSNGRCVVYWASDSAIVPGDNNLKADIFVHDLLTRRTARVSIGAAGAQASHSCKNPSISNDGQWITFDTLSGSLAPPDIDGFTDVLIARNPLPAIYAAEANQRQTLQRKVKQLKKKLKKAKKRKKRNQIKKYGRQIGKFLRQIRAI